MRIELKKVKRADALTKYGGPLLMVFRFRGY